MSWKRPCAIILFCVAPAIISPAQTVTTLHSFNGSDGGQPNAGLVEGTDGALYGTTERGGGHGRGTIFEITTSATQTTLYSFCAEGPTCTDGQSPYSGLVQATNGDFYGTTAYGGSFGFGTMYKITPRGKLTRLLSFGKIQGSEPVGGLIQAVNGDLYGTTQFGGPSGNGTIFQSPLGGPPTVLFGFNYTDGDEPTAGLVEASSGDFYGTTRYGGTTGMGGTIFKITSKGALTTLISFPIAGSSESPFYPTAPLVQATDGYFYGTTSAGGEAGDCIEGGVTGCGTVFKISPDGTLTTLHNFNGMDGATPEAGLVQATNGNLYGTTSAGGAYASGAIFEITPDGTLTTVYSFCSQLCTDGSYPVANLVQHTNGNLYGTTVMGGAFGEGVVFSLSLGLPPFIKTLPTASEVGALVRIFGTDMADATSVNFNSTPAVFTAVSNSLIIATVPNGATTGKVQVITPSGTLVSNVGFLVR